MIDPTLQPGALPQASPAGVRAPATTPSSAPVDAQTAIRGARFQSLLEELDLRAKAMARTAQEPISAEELPSALERARSSMQDALELSRNLLEACRQSSAQAPAPKTQRP